MRLLLVLVVFLLTIFTGCSDNLTEKWEVCIDYGDSTKVFYVLATYSNVERESDLVLFNNSKPVFNCAKDHWIYARKLSSSSLDKLIPLNR